MAEGSVTGTEYAVQTAELPHVQLPDEPAVLCDCAGVIRQANPAALVLTGAESGDDLVGGQLDALLDGAEPTSRLLRADGTDCAVRVLRCPLPATNDTDAGQQIVLLIGAGELLGANGSAVTDAMRAEWRRLTEAQRVARMALWEYDHATATMVWPANFYDLLGLCCDSVAPGLASMLDRVHTEDRASLRQAWEEHLRTGRPVQIEFRVVLGGGATRWVQVVAASEAKSSGAERDGSRKTSGYLRDITERREASAALITERAKLIEAQRLAKIGSWSYEVATGVVYRSDVLHEMYAEIGVAPDGDLLFNVHPADRPEAERVHSQVLHAKHEETIELEVRGAIGEKVYLTRSRAELGASGAVVQLHGTIQDITEQRMLERQLSEDRRRLYTAQRVARLGTWEWDPDTGAIVWSAVLYELFGIGSDSLVDYHGYLQMVHPDDRAWVDARWQHLVADHRQIECEYRITRADGAERVLCCHGAAVTTPAGKVLMVGTAQDITEQCAIQARMQRSSQRFTDLVTVTPIGIGLFDEAARVLDANDALCELLGVPIERLRGTRSESFIQADDIPAHRRTLRSVLSGGSETVSIPQRKIVTAAGEVIYCAIHVKLSVQDDGQRFWIAVFSDVTEQRRAADALRYQATHDDLTGLPNRAAVNLLLSELLSADTDAGTDPSNIAVLFCDIDNFKRVNDSLGHDAGDELLVVLARRLQDGLGEECTAARLSGDEFVIICSDIEAVGGVDALATRVSTLLRNAVPIRGQLVRATASIGAAVPNRNRVTGADLLRFADAAMFEAKRRGAGRVSLADAELIASAERQVHLEGELRDALYSDGLRLYYQPVVGVDGRVITAEALLRWSHPERGLITPDVFLPIAEQGDLLRDMDRWVLRRALTEAASWPAPDGRHISVAVNLAVLVPGDPGFVDAVTDAIAESGIASDRVILELVETSLIDLPSRSLSAMASLVEQGVRFAVDDFGTGYSSLARLKELPAQIIKVDRSFVAGVGEDPSDFAVARAVVEMARAMGRSCVAEGVETATQFNVLRVVGVDAYQGWLFSRAVPPRELRELLKHGHLHVPRSR